MAQGARQGPAGRRPAAPTAKIPNSCAVCTYVLERIQPIEHASVDVQSHAARL
jgi:hypothetical protein